MTILHACLTLYVLELVLYEWLQRWIWSFSFAQKCTYSFHTENNAFILGTRYRNMRIRHFANRTTLFHLIVTVYPCWFPHSQILWKGCIELIYARYFLNDPWIQTNQVFPSIFKEIYNFLGQDEEVWTSLKLKQDIIYQRSVHKAETLTLKVMIELILVTCSRMLLLIYPQQFPSWTLKNLANRLSSDLEYPGNFYYFYACFTNTQLSICISRRCAPVKV